MVFWPKDCRETKGSLKHLSLKHVDIGLIVRMPTT